MITEEKGIMWLFFTFVLGQEVAVSLSDMDFATVIHGIADFYYVFYIGLP